MQLSWLLPFFLLMLETAPVDRVADHALKAHFRAHSQTDWEGFESLTAQGEWHIGPLDYNVDYQIKSPNKWVAFASVGEQKIISNNLFAGTFGLDSEEQKGEAFAPTEAMALSYVWSFGSPLFRLKEKIVRMDDVQVDQKPCYWYQYKEDKRIFDYYITKKDHLYYKTNISNQEGTVISSTTVKQYRSFGPYPLPSQVTVKTNEIDYLFVFTDYTIGDYVNDRVFTMTQ